MWCSCCWKASWRTLLSVSRTTSEHKASEIVSAMAVRARCKGTLIASARRTRCTGHGQGAAGSTHGEREAYLEKREAYLREANLGGARERPIWGRVHCAVVSGGDVQGAGSREQGGDVPSRGVAATRVIVGPAAEALGAPGVADGPAPLAPIVDGPGSGDTRPAEETDAPVGPPAEAAVFARLAAGRGDDEIPAPPAPLLWAPGMPGIFLQLTHLQLSVHAICAWKHSQYFLRQPDFLQWQPLLWRIASPVPSAPALIFGRKACGLRSSVCAIAFLRFSSFSGLLWHPWQLHAKQYWPDAKHSQYSLRHRLLRQLHALFFGAPPRFGLPMSPSGGENIGAWAGERQVAATQHTVVRKGSSEEPGSYTIGCSKQCDSRRERGVVWRFAAALYNPTDHSSDSRTVAIHATVLLDFS